MLTLADLGIAPPDATTPAVHEPNKASLLDRARPVDSALLDDALQAVGTADVLSAAREIFRADGDDVNTAAWLAIGPYADNEQALGGLQILLVREFAESAAMEAALRLMVRCGSRWREAYPDGLLREVDKWAHWRQGKDARGNDF